MGKGTNQEFFKTIFELDGKQAEVELKKLEEHAENLYNQLKAARKANDLAGANQLEKELKDANREAAKYKQNVVDVKAVLDNLSGASLKDLLATQKKMTAELSSMTRGTKEWVQASEKIKQVDAEIKNTRASMRSAEVQQQSWLSKGADGFNKYFGVITAGLAAFTGIIFSIKQMIQGNADLDDSLANIRKTTGMTTQEVNALNESLSKINTRTSREELRQIAVVAGQLGISKDQVLGFTKSVDQLNVALGDEFTGGAEAVATEMGKIRNVFTDIKSDNVAEDMLHIGNAINELGAAGFATGPVMADFSNRIGGVGISLGLTSGQVLGMSATLQELNVNAERGGTAVSKIMQKMTTDTASFAQVAGMDVKEFTELVNKDLYGAFIKVVEGSQKGGTSATAMGKILNDLGVDGAGAAEVFTKLGGNTKMLTEKVDLANKSLRETNSITNEFNIKNETLGAKMEKIGKSIRGAFVNNGAKEAIEGIVDGMYEWMELDISSEMEKERNTVNGLAMQLMDANLPAEDRNKLYAELKQLAPGVLEGLDKEALNYKKLQQNLEAYNNEMINKIVLQKKDSEVEEQNNKVASVRQKRLEEEQKVGQDLYNLYEIIKAQSKFSTSGITNVEVNKAENTLSDATKSMAEKYAIFKDLLSKSVMGYNKGISAEVENTLMTINNLKKQEEALLSTSSKLIEERKKIAEALKLSTTKKEEVVVTDDPNKTKTTVETEEERKARLEKAAKEAEEAAKRLKEKIQKENEAEEAVYNKNRADANTAYNNSRVIAEQQFQEKLKTAANPKERKAIEEQYYKDAEKAEKDHTAKLEDIEGAHILMKIAIAKANNQDTSKLEEEYSQHLLDIQKNRTAEQKKLYEEENKEVESAEKRKQALLKKYGLEDYAAILDEQMNLILAELDAELGTTEEAEQKKAEIRSRFAVEKAERAKSDAENKNKNAENTVLAKKVASGEITQEQYNKQSNIVSGGNDITQNGDGTQAGFTDQLANVSNNELIQVQLNEEAYKQGLRSKEEYEKKLNEITRNATAERVKIVNEGFNKMNQIASFASNFISVLQDTELTKEATKKAKALKAAGNDSKKKEKIEEESAANELKIKKKYADKQFYMQVASITASTAVAAINAFNSFSAIPVVGTVLGAIAAAAAVAFGVVQVNQAKAQRDSVAQLAKGKYDVIGADDGKEYKNVPLQQRLQSGLVSSPTLVAEQPEIVMDTETTRFAMVNYPKILSDMNTLRERRVPQAAKGKYTEEVITAKDKKSTTQTTSFDAELKQMLSDNIEVLDALKNGVRAYFTTQEVVDIRKETKRQEKIEADASLK